MRWYYPPYHRSNRRTAYRSPSKRHVKHMRRRLLCLVEFKICPHPAEQANDPSLTATEAQPSKQGSGHRLCSKTIDSGHGIRQSTTTCKPLYPPINSPGSTLFRLRLADRISLASKTNIEAFDPQSSGTTLFIGGKGCTRASQKETKQASKQAGSLGGARGGSRKNRWERKATANLAYVAMNIAGQE